MEFHSYLHRVRFRVGNGHDNQMSEHAILSPSSAHRWINCPGSIRLCKGVEETSSEYADLGTFAHKIAAECLSKNVDPHTYVGKEDETKRFVCDMSMADYIKDYLVIVHGIFLFAKPYGGKISVEKKIKINDDCWGTIDCTIVQKNHIDILDFKYGSGLFVEATNNPQLKMYALGALKTTIAHNMKTVILHIVQPRLERSGNIHRQEKLTIADLLNWKTDVLDPAIKQTKRKNAKLATGDHCQFCPAKHICPKLREVAKATAKEVFATKKVPNVEELDTNQIAEILEVAPLVETWLSSVRSHAYQLMNSGKTVPGFKLVHKQSNRKWIDDKLSEDVLSMYIDPLAPAKILTPAQAEKKLAKDFKFVVSDLAIKPDAGTTLVPSSDKREEVPILLPSDVFSEDESKGEK